MKRICVLVAALLTLPAASAAAQDRLGGDAPTFTYRPGWTITPTIGVSETYDDNITLFGPNTADQLNNDVIAAYFPGLDVHYIGKFTQVGGGYSGSFLDYHTYTALNRWDQHANLELKRQESAHLKWFGRGSVAVLPSTDFIDLGGIPYRRNGARTADGRGGLEYTFSGTDAISSSADYEAIDFEQAADLRGELRGGHVLESLTGWRHRLDARLALGADYSFRRAMVIGDPEMFNLHAIQAAVDYELSPEWSLSGAGGVVYMQSTATIEGHLGPAYRIAIERHRVGRRFHASYVRSYIPSFGFGGTVQNQEASAGFQTPLFNNRRVYFDATGVFRDDEPLSNPALQLPLRSLRIYTTVGWEPQPWVRVEGFYARTQQTSLRFNGQIYRNRIGFQIVTSKPVRIQ
jgi:hypothetical protein